MADAFVCDLCDGVEKGKSKNNLKASSIGEIFNLDIHLVIRNQDQGKKLDICGTCVNKILDTCQGTWQPVDGTAMYATIDGSINPIGYSGMVLSTEADTITTWTNLNDPLKKKKDGLWTRFKGGNRKYKAWCERRLRDEKGRFMKAIATAATAEMG